MSSTARSTQADPSLTPLDAPRPEALEYLRTGEAAYVHSWELVTAVDGPGTRLSVFLSGCPLRCVYCHNPDTLQSFYGTVRTMPKLVRTLKRYRRIFEATGGGVTFTGGEPLSQPMFLRRALHAARELGIHTALDTSGFYGARASDEMLADVSLVLLDVKSGDETTYSRVTGQPLQPTLAFGDRLAALGVPVWIRFVLVPGWTDAPENVERVATIAAGWSTVVERVEVLPFHQMGRDKWAEVNMTYQLDDVEPPSREQAEAVREVFRAKGLTTF